MAVTWSVMVTVWWVAGDLARDCAVDTAAPTTASNNKETQQQIPPRPAPSQPKMSPHSTQEACCTTADWTVAATGDCVGWWLAAANNWGEVANYGGGGQLWIVCVGRRNVS